jgi:hypothetical protein
MRRWYVIPRGPQEANLITDVVEEGDLGAEALKRFDAAWKAREYQGREVIGMWIEDKSTEQGDVIKAEGRIPQDVAIQHEEYKARTKR